MELDGNGGWIYVLMTSADYNRFKVGRTSLNPLDRYKALRTGDPQLGFVVAYFVPASLWKLSHVEAALHQEFEQRILFLDDESRSEWFIGTAETACQWIEWKFDEWMERPVSSMHLFGQGVICRAYEDDLIHLYGPRPPLNPIDGLPM